MTQFPKIMHYLRQKTGCAEVLFMYTRSLFGAFLIWVPLTKSCVTIDRRDTWIFRQTVIIGDTKRRSEEFIRSVLYQVIPGQREWKEMMSNIIHPDTLAFDTGRYTQSKILLFSSKYEKIGIYFKDIRKYIVEDSQ